MLLAAQRTVDVRADGVNIAKFTPKVMDKQDKTLYNKIKLRNITYRAY